MVDSRRELAYCDSEQYDAFESYTRGMEKVGGGAYGRRFYVAYLMLGVARAGCSVSS